ncbi:helix-turn-helix domain-containing protein [Streptomyces sp. NBC_00059]|uniref:helix-turn-helix domain-containing protein n=1 Tax=Streptomyces sp. NBC_00059 TaxID=2975635 RepID=UPI00224F49EF|nr:helix-turn-helix domain-containing protein [Streptomyces sp. NBC_00059]MCX5411265.1 helix-turn-helix domain-containing protein [Streptomyces sp. NBC_00059]
MTQRSRGPMSFAEAFELPLIMDLRTAARVFGVCPSTAYKLVRLGCFPCPVLRLGHQYRIPTSHVLRVLGIDERPVYAVPLEPDAEDDSGSPDVPGTGTEASHDRHDVDHPC